MVSIPERDNDIDDEEAPSKAIREINFMFPSLCKESPSVKFSPWPDCSTKKYKLVTKNSIV